MKFEIYRTSGFGMQKPCEEAFIDKVIHIDERFSDSPSKLPDSEKWFSKGSNHRVENGNIKRDLEREVYVVEINTLSELIDLSNKYGDLIIDKNTIEIYDDYRE